MLLVASACNTYYIPPPPLSIYLAAPTSDLVISALNNDGQVVPSTLALQGVVSNSPNTTILYSVGQQGIYVAGGNAIYGYITPDGTYQAPLVVPTPNKVVIKAAAQADTTETATWTLTLLNPTALVTSVTPATVTAGLPASLDVIGTNFAQGATVNMSGASITSTNLISPTEMKVSATIEQPGMLGLSVINPDPFGPPNSMLVRSLPSNPPTSSAIAVTAGVVGSDANGNPVTASEAYVPRPSALAVVNLDTGQQIGTVNMPSGFQPSLAAADPAGNEILVASFSSDILQVVDTRQDAVTHSFKAPVATSVTINGGTCMICAMVVDSARHDAILDTAAGYFTLDLSTGKTSTPVHAPASLNFAYDSETQRVFVPYASGTGSSGSGVYILNLQQGTKVSVTPQGASFGAQTTSATWDPTSGILTAAADSDASTFVSLNLNNAQQSNGSSATPASQFTVTSGCPLPWRGMGVDLVGHLGWLANAGGCIAVAGLPEAAVNGTPAQPNPLHWARVPAAPDGLAWQSSTLEQPSTIAAYTGSDGRAYGLVLRQDGQYLLKVDLGLLQQATALDGGYDANQVDPTHATQNGQTVSSITYIRLH
ncbi:MAG: YncE family protein [Terriglobales bacterium]